MSCSRCLLIKEKTFCSDLEKVLSKEPVMFELTDDTAQLAKHSNTLMGTKTSNEIQISPPHNHVRFGLRKTTSRAKCSGKGGASIKTLHTFFF